MNFKNVKSDKYTAPFLFALYFFPKQIFNVNKYLPEQKEH